MALEAWGEAGESVTPYQAGDREATGRAGELHRVSSGGGAEELDDTSGDSGSKGLDGTNRGYETRDSGENKGGRMSLDGTRASKQPEGTGVEA